MYSEKWVRGAWDPTAAPAAPAAVRLSRSAPRAELGSPLAQSGTRWGHWRCAELESLRASRPAAAVWGGDGRRHLRPFLSSKLFRTPTSPAARCVGGSGVLRILASGRAWRDRGGG